MEKEKKIVKKPTTKNTASKPASKPKVAEKPKATNKKTVAPAKPKKAIESTVEKVEIVKAETENTKTDNATAKSKTTLNQELNLLIALFSIMTLICLCFEFQGGTSRLLGWELILNVGYSGIFKGLMVVYLISIIIDCLLSVRIDTENEIINIIQKLLYTFTLIINFIVGAILITLISNIGIGLIIFLILSIISIIVKCARIYAQNK